MRKIIIMAAISLSVMAVSCTKAGPEPFTVVPQPNEVVLSEGAFRLAPAFTVKEDVPEKAKEAIAAFQARIAEATGKNAVEGPAVTFSYDPSLSSEQYVLDVDGSGVRVSASAYNGYLYAMQTIRQMLPAEIYAQGKVSKPLLLQYVHINDAPRFAYRGMHADPCRHFFDVNEVKRYLDIMAVYKLNTFHWHLTDDQGWRIEIKKYPRLTEVGAWRNGTMIAKDWGSNDGIRYGGFYTQDQLREIVAYAANLGITVIPEVDLPGHMVAALAAYPELGCTGGPYEVWQRWGVARDILCAGNPKVYEFLEDVFTEVMDIFPSEYIYIGGDECFTNDPKRPDPWEVCPKCQAKMRELGIRPHDGFSKKQLLQAHVTAHMQKFLSDHGRKMAGWDEILDGDLMPGATILSWRGPQGGVKAASKGFDAIMCPVDYCYFDFYQSDKLDLEPLCIGGNLPIEKVYSHDPVKGVPADKQKHIIGVQANLWTEYISTVEHLEYMLLPRLSALSEVQWCQPSNKDYDRFKATLDHQAAIYDVMGYNYSKDFWGLYGLEFKPAE